MTRALRGHALRFCQDSCQTWRREMRGVFGLCSLENRKHSRSAAEVKQAAVVGGDGLVVASAEAKEVAEFVVASTETLCRSEALEAPHTSCHLGRAASHTVHPRPLVPLVPEPTSPAPAGKT